jgi:hypothetical protein
VAEDCRQVRTEGPARPARQGRDRDLVDQVAEEGRLGEDLDVEERRRGLQRDRRQRLASMEPAGGMDVAERDREEQPPGKLADPSPETGGERVLAIPDGVVATFDRVEQGVEMPGRPGSPRARDQDERRRGIPEAPGERVAPTGLGHGDHGRLDGASSTGQEPFQRPRDGRGPGTVVLGQDDHPDGGVTDGIAPEVGIEGVELGAVGRGRGRGHSSSHLVAQAG